MLRPLYHIWAEAHSGADTPPVVLAFLSCRRYLPRKTAVLWQDNAAQLEVYTLFPKMQRQIGGVAASSMVRWSHQIHKEELFHGIFR